jgi:hypothetical protein
MTTIINSYYSEPIGPNPYVSNPYVSNPYVSNQHIPRTLKTKVNFSDTNLLFEYLSNNYLNFQLEYSNNLSTFINSHTGKNLPDHIYYKFKFFPEFASLLMSTSIVANLIPNQILNNHIQLILDEFKTCLPSKYIQKSFLLKMFNFMENLRTNTDNIYIGSFNDISKSPNTARSNGYIIVAKQIAVIVNTDYVIINLNMDNSIFELIITSKYLKIRFDDNVCTIKLGQTKTAAFAYGKDFTNLICSSYDEFNTRLKYRLDYAYKSKNTSKRIRNITYRSPTELYSKTWQNQNQFYEVHYSNEVIDKTIVKCMMSGSDGLRFRGKQTTTIDRTTNESTTTIKFGDQTQYEKKKNVVLTDLINNKLNLDDSTIGWKVCQNANGEKRIIKLFIPAEAKKVIPIGDDFLTSNFKERADQAIVMDIQLADLETETSVVPSETEAFSYIHNSAFTYKVGQQVMPDSFDPNPDSGCSNGIHYFRNRRSVFKTYLESYEDIDL